jgi:hypothetical protein
MLKARGCSPQISTYLSAILVRQKFCIPSKHGKASALEFNKTALPKAEDSAEASLEPTSDKVGKCCAYQASPQTASALISPSPDSPYSVNARRIRRAASRSIARNSGTQR